MTSGPVNKEAERRVFAAFDRWKAVDDIHALSVFDRTLVLVWSFLGITMGEGLGDFFDTSTAIYRDENVAALERIGATEAAEILRQTNVVFSKWDREHDHGQTGSGREEGDDESLLDDLEERLSMIESAVWRLLDDYAEKGDGRG